ncbi:MAG: coiled-coil protein [uncultured bacterium]|nr:MAG: coiled-coil protein [uncultured bacterium]
MDNFKKSFVVGIGVIVFLVAVVAALNMSDNSPRPLTKSIRNGMSMVSRDSSMMPIGGSAKNLASPMMESYGERSFPETAQDSIAPDMSPISSEVQKKEIKNGNLGLRVNNADSATEKISKIAKDNGGEVFSSNFYQTDKNIKNGNVEVRVPVREFEKTFSEIKDVATLVIRESTYGQDVTMEYSDLQIQLKNKQTEEQAFLKILDQTGKISDILDVTQEVARVRGEIESLQGRIRFMDSQTDMASISISMTEDTNVAFSDKWRPAQVAKETINMLFKDMQGFVNFLIVLVIRVIPVMFLYSLIILAVYFIVKRFFFKR